MAVNGYLKWMAENTQTQWCNDSALTSRVRDALAAGAVGCTTNPPLTSQALSETPGDFTALLASIGSDCVGDARAEALTGAVAGTIASLLRPTFEASNGRVGYVRAQVQPSLSQNANAMLEMGLRYAAIAPNVMVKIPGTRAGVWVLEELAARGVPTTPTICLTVSQMIAVAEANERGAERARRAGRHAAESTAAIVFGRTQDYLSLLNEQRNAGLSLRELEWAGVAVAKRCHAIFRERGYRQIVMPAAFRSAWQIAEFSGGAVCMTIRPDFQDGLFSAEARGDVRRAARIDEEIDPAILAHVKAVIPEFANAYEPDGLPPDAFDEYPGVVMTLDSFDRTGWRKLQSLQESTG